MSALITEHGPLYKVLNEDGSARMGTGSWPLPVDGEPGAWMKVTGELVPCEHGLHLSPRQDLVEWIGPAIFEAEARGHIVVAQDKIVVSEARLLRRLDTWNERTARLFAADCAEHILDALEDRYPSDPRSRKAIEVARLFANGQATEADLAAARAAAGAAAWAAAWAAAGAAARAAAGAAAWAAAWAAAGDAAGAAARDAAGDAAGDAAWAAAGDAAWDAAWAAAWAAERAWQSERLWWYLNGEAA